MTPTLPPFAPAARKPLALRVSRPAMVVGAFLLEHIQGGVISYLEDCQDRVVATLHAKDLSLYYPSAVIRVSELKQGPSFSLWVPTSLWMGGEMLCRIGKPHES